LANNSRQGKMKKVIGIMNFQSVVWAAPVAIALPVYVFYCGPNTLKVHG